MVRALLFGIAVANRTHAPTRRRFAAPPPPPPPPAPARFARGGRDGASGSSDAFSSAILVSLTPARDRFGAAARGKFPLTVSSPATSGLPNSPDFDEYPGQRAAAP